MPIKRKDKPQDLLDYEALCDIWKEANAVDTVIGRPDVLMQKIAKLRDDMGRRKPQSRKDWEAGYEQCRQDGYADAYREAHAAPYESAAVSGEVSDSLALLVECRDAFPVPPQGSPLEQAWAQAMGEPECIPDYVRAAVLALVK